MANMIARRYRFVRYRSEIIEIKKITAVWGGKFYRAYSHGASDKMLVNKLTDAGCVKAFSMKLYSPPLSTPLTEHW